MSLISFLIFAGPPGQTVSPNAWKPKERWIPGKGVCMLVLWYYLWCWSIDQQTIKLQDLCGSCRCLRTCVGCVLLLLCCCCCVVVGCVLVVCWLCVGCVLVVCCCCVLLLCCCCVLLLCCCCCVLVVCWLCFGLPLDLPLDLHDHRSHFTQARSKKLPAPVPGTRSKYIWQNAIGNPVVPLAKLRNRKSWKFKGFGKTRIWLVITKSWQTWAGKNCGCNWKQWRAPPMSCRRRALRWGVKKHLCLEGCSFLLFRPRLSKMIF